MTFEISKENSKLMWWHYTLIGIFLFWLGSTAFGGDLGRAIVTIGWGPFIVGIVKLFKKPKKLDTK